MSAPAQTTEVVTATEQGQPPQPAKSQQQNNNNNNNNNNNAANNKKRIIIRNLPPGTTRDELRELCGRYGRVINVEIVSKQHRPFGFVSFLTEEDAGYSAYRLDGHRYKDYDLNATESNPKGNNNNNQNTRNNARNAPRGGAPGTNNNNNNNNNNQPKKKKTMYSLRTLTPHNPPTMNQTPMLPVKPPVVPNTIREDEQVSNTKFSQGPNENQVHQSPIAGQNAEAGGQPNTNNYPRNNRRRNNNNQDQGQKRNNNNRNPRNRGEFRPVQQKRQSDTQSENNVNEDAKQDTTSSTPNPSPQVDKPAGQNNTQNRSQANKPNQSQGNRQGPQKRYNSNNNRSRGRRSGGQGQGGQVNQGGQSSQGNQGSQGSQGNQGSQGQKNNNKNQGIDNSGNKQELIVASVQYSADNQPVTNVKVNVSKKDISLNLKLNPEEFKQFLSVLQPFIEKNKSIDNQNVNDTKNGNNNKKISSPL